MKKKIEEAARELAKEKGLINITRAEVCKRAGVADGAFTYIMEESFTELISRLTQSGELPTGTPEDKKRTNPDIRRKHILDIAIKLAEKKCYDDLTREEVAAAANVSPALVSHYFKLVSNLHREVLYTAIQNKNHHIIAQGYIKRDPVVHMYADEKLIRQSVIYVAEA